VKNTAEKRVTNVEFVNGVHPLHWATSSGPSPMGTDPIKSSKMVQKWLESTSATTVKHKVVQSLQDYSANYNWFSRARKPY
jgi:hypothetical protein